MLSFFPHPYPDELLYSVLARYHRRSGNNKKSQTMVDLFNSTSATANINFIIDLETLTNNLPNYWDYTEDYFIFNNTLFPLYAPFLDQEKYDKIIKLMKEKSNNNKRFGDFGNLFNPTFFRFCPKCIEEDFIQYGELYWHRAHQVLSTSVCSKHKVFIMNSSVPIKNFSSQEYIAATTENCKADTILYNNNPVYLNHLIKIANDIDWLLQNKINPKSHNWIKDIFMTLLRDKGYIISVKGMVNQKRLNSDFIDYYGAEFLNLVNSSVNFDSNRSHSWLSIIFRRNSREYHPIRYILVSHFLERTISQIFNEKVEYYPFGKGPWPCLNKAADHYLEPVINEIKISRLKKTKQPLATFSCSCGFVFSRRGPDKTYNDRFLIGNIKERGFVFENKIKEMIYEQKIPKKEVRGLFNVGGQVLNRILSNQNKYEKSSEYNLLLEKHRKEWLNLQKEYPHLSKKELSKITSSSAWLLKNDREWYTANSPLKRKNNKKGLDKIDWSLRDFEILEIVKKEVKKLQTPVGKPERFSIGIIARLCNLKVLQQDLNKMPRTSAFLHDLVKTETLEVHHIRKIHWAAKNLLLEGNSVNISNIIVKASLTWKSYLKIQKEIESLINYYTQNVVDQVAVSKE